jgi:DNA-binding ferritin-like protein (Dps family)
MELMKILKEKKERRWNITHLTGKDTATFMDEFVRPREYIWTINKL